MTGYLRLILEEKYLRKCLVYNYNENKLPGLRAGGSLFFTAILSHFLTICKSDIGSS